MRPKTTVFVVFVLLVVIFLVQNSEAIPIQFLFWNFKISGSLFLLVSVILSSLVGYIFGRVDDDRRERKQQEKVSKSAMENQE